MIKNTIYALAIVALLAGCQAMPYKPYARKVKVSPQEGGIVALKIEHNNEDRTFAEGIMSSTCRNNQFDILEEGEVVIGSETTSNETSKAGTEGTQVGSLWGIPVTSGATDPSKNTNSTTLQKKEWQIKYKCTQVAKAKSNRKSI